jgi:hypothetical protein
MNRRARMPEMLTGLVGPTEGRSCMAMRSAGKHLSTIGSRGGSFYFRRYERIVGGKACDNISISSNM